MVLVQETLDGRLGRPCDVTPEAGALAGPPEGIALAVLLGEHQQDLQRQGGMDAWVRQCCCDGDNYRVSMLVDLHYIYYSDRTFSRAAADIQEPHVSCVHLRHHSYSHLWP